MDFLKDGAYLWGILLLCPFWLYILIKRKESRKEILIVGSLFGIAAILIGKFYALKDYWNPPYLFTKDFPIEDFLYGLVFGGLCTEFFEVFFHLQESKRKYKKHKNLLIWFAVITALSFIVIVDVIKLNSIIAHIVPPIIIGIFTVILRRDLLVPSLLSGLFIVIITFMWQFMILIIYPNAISDIWFVQNLSGILILGIPIEELLFAFSLGFGGANFYEFVIGKGFIKFKPIKGLYLYKPK